jgi:hypothetical protein
MTAREAGGTFVPSPRDPLIVVIIDESDAAEQPAPVFTPKAFCPSGQRVVKVRDGMPVCAAPVKRPAFDFRPGWSS